MESLPSETILNILRLLPPSDLENCQLVNHRFNALIERDRKNMQTNTNIQLRVHKKVGKLKLDVFKTGNTESEVCFTIHRRNLFVSGVWRLPFLAVLQKITGFNPRGTSTKFYLRHRNILPNLIHFIAVRANITSVDLQPTVTKDLRNIIVRTLMRSKCNRIEYIFNSGFDVDRKLEEFKLLKCCSIASRRVDSSQDTKNMILKMPFDFKCIVKAIIPQHLILQKLKHWFDNSEKRDAYFVCLTKARDDWEHNLFDFSPVNMTESLDVKCGFLVQRVESDILMLAVVSISHLDLFCLTSAKRLDRIHSLIDRLNRIRSQNHEVDVIEVLFTDPSLSF